MKRHRLDPYPLPKEKEDNIRVYIPLDLNKDAILRRLDAIIERYEEANEFDFSMEGDAIISQIENYDQVWFVRIF